jgi:phosphatidate cytidylyltransferase
MSNTQKRIISAVVMGCLVIGALIGGTHTTIAAFLIVALLSTDEIFCNLFSGKRLSLGYIFTQVITAGSFIYLNFFESISTYASFFIYTSLAINTFLISYLFLVDQNNKKLITFSKKVPSVSLLIILPAFITLATILGYGPWVKLLGALLVINFSMDTGAWFFGKNFGKNKLWPTVSPNKTIEGLIGGVFTSGILGGLYWYIVFGQLTISLVSIFMLMGLFSQVGDLIQSKMKRQCGIKDSSSLIPGHGGVYDRIDSLIFLSPFFAAFLKYFITF